MSGSKVIFDDTKKAEQFCKMSTEIDAINIKVDKNIQKD